VKHTPSVKFRRAEAAALLTVFLLVSVQLMWPPMIGLANNGDFWRMTDWGALKQVETRHEDIYFNWITREYKFVGNPVTTRGSWPSSEIVFVKPAVALWYWMVSNQSFDLRMLGLIHILAFALSFFILMRGLGAGFSYLYFAPWFVLIFCDLSYTIYFHSFYTEQASLIFPLATVGAGLNLLKEKQKSTPRGLAILLLFFACACLLVCVKTQNVIFAPAVAFFGLRLALFNRDRRWGITALGCASLVVLLALAEYRRTDVSLINASKYNAIFFGALTDSPDPRQDLRDLGVSEEYAELVGTQFWQPSHPFNISSRDFEESYYPKISFLKILFFYLERPGRFLDKIQESLKRAYVPRPEYAGNFEKASGKMPREQSHRWNLWGLFKKYYFPKSVWFFFAYLMATAALILAAWRRSQSIDQKLVWEFYFALWLTIPITLLTPLLGDGFSDFERHMLPFNFLMDFSLLLLFGHMTALVVGKLISREGRQDR
jgi:hypothetical protein